jgi:hypothetical protein
MNIIDFLSICGIIIIIIVIIIIIYNHCKINNFYRVRNNRINPEILEIINYIIQERNKERNKKEIELKMKNLNKVIIINPDNNIELGIQEI